jgi:hypothetical protein
MSRALGKNNSSANFSNVTSSPFDSLKKQPSQQQQSILTKDNLKPGASKRAIDDSDSTRSDFKKALLMNMTVTTSSKTTHSGQQASKADSLKNLNNSLQQVGSYKKLVLSVLKKK